ncbi:VOC family protein [Solilutibacter silvestris]|uniref:VOC family protein n=1 Tax=Solilutibacter silvestris TaxID=1645665 RepID=UPI003D34C3FC
MQLIAYLNFDGNAREAMDFYAQALGGKVTQRFTYGESPMAEQCGPDSADKVMHSQVEVGEVTLMGADGPPPHAAGSTTINIVTDTAEEAERIFAAMSAGGTVQMPIAETFWAHRFGMFTDKFGKGWLVNCRKPMN